MTSLKGYVIDVPTLADLKPTDYLKPSQRAAMASRAAKPPRRTLAEYRAQRIAQAAANAQAKAEAKAAAKATKARQRAERGQAKAQAAREFKRSFTGPPKSRGYRPPPKVRTEAEVAEMVERDRSTHARLDAKAAYLSERRKVEQARYGVLAQCRPALAAPMPRPHVDLVLMADAAALVLERRRKAMAEQHAAIAVMNTNT
ncbi:hypothetical protein [Variovorax sp. JS1663]|uniref:hypothetical protein n=1 Tax=Variovorax sp. JS1663 TaxID=1851577 RepID=UPI000B708A33|nr:hypothetical protein [Variovorax sp. JS1663]OUL98772.1 hypothetical protein A8M77_29970 [Variovorax sp. JS1663]